MLAIGVFVDHVITVTYARHVPASCLCTRLTLFTVIIVHYSIVYGCTLFSTVSFAHRSINQTKNFPLKEGSDNDNGLLLLCSLWMHNNICIVFWNGARSKSIITRKNAQNASQKNCQIIGSLILRTLFTLISGLRSTLLTELYSGLVIYIKYILLYIINVSAQ